MSTRVPPICLTQQVSTLGPVSFLVVIGTLERLRHSCGRPGRGWKEVRDD